jgi:FtsH-binding integral membrane protein
MPQVNFVALLKQKFGFLLSVYVTLIIQFIITFMIVFQFRNNTKLSNATRQSFWIYAFVSLGLIIILNINTLPIWLKFIIFTFFSIVNGALLHNATQFIPKEFITEGLQSTILIFAVMTIVAFILAYLGVNLNFLGMILLGALIGLIAATILHIILERGDNKSLLYKTLRIFGIILFSIYIVFFTNMILQKEYHDDFINGALDLYLSSVNLFTNLLSLERP